MLPHVGWWFLLGLLGCAYHGACATLNFAGEKQMAKPEIMPTAEKGEGTILVERYVL